MSTSSVQRRELNVVIESIGTDIHGINHDQYGTCLVRVHDQKISRYL